MGKRDGSETRSKIDRNEEGGKHNRASLLIICESHARRLKHIARDSRGNSSAPPRVRDLDSFLPFAVINWPASLVSPVPLHSTEF